MEEEIEMLGLDNNQIFESLYQGGLWVVVLDRLA